MKTGDKVKLNEQGKKVRVESMESWKGEVVGFRGRWVKVLWKDAPLTPCKACNGDGEVALPWEEHKDYLEKA